LGGTRKKDDMMGYREMMKNHMMRSGGIKKCEGVGTLSERNHKITKSNREGAKKNQSERAKIGGGTT